MSDYYKKYLKYKYKYKILQLGGYNFETLYKDLMNFCINYNKSRYLINEIFDEKIILHIKGGASIKYYMNKKNIDSTNITSDIDILILSDNNDIDKENTVSELYNELSENFKQYNWNYKIFNGLYNICIDNYCIFDITFINTLENTEDSMFLYAVKSLGYNNIHEYADYILSLSQENLEKVTFTSLKFEYYSTTKGIINQIEYLNSIDEWKNNLEQFKLKLKLNYYRLTSTDRSFVEDRIKVLTWQTSNEYINILKNKLNRYIIKHKIIIDLLLPDNLHQ